MADAGGCPAVFLDRDGVLNRSIVVAGKPYAPRRLADFRLLPGVVGAVDRLKHAGFLVVAVTNQPDIANGLVSPELVAAMNGILRRKLRVDDVVVCPHGQSEGCACRKPKPGMLLEAAERFGIDPTQSWMVGDRFSDMQAGRAAGCRTIKIDRGYREDRMVDSACCDYRVNTLPHAVKIITQAGAIAPV